jgi:flagellar basal-body rod protein FlgC
MPVDSILDAARAGLDYERLRLDAASRNIANANVPVAPGQAAQQWQVLTAGIQPGGLQSAEAVTTQGPMATRDVHDPANPMADAHGNVRYPAVDLVQEMTTLMSASRGYEANVRSFNLLRGMMLHALEIGAK